MRPAPKKIPTGPMANPPQEIADIEKAVLDYLMANYTKMIFAKDDADFEAQKIIAQDYIYDRLGYQEFEDDLNDRWQAAYDAVN